MEKGLVKDWGSFSGESKGYSIYDTTKVEMMKSLQQYVPFVKFRVHPVATVSDVNEMLKALSG